jgi:energy-coupling factor transporter ATP-binding protein EcfA2
VTPELPATLRDLSEALGTVELELAVPGLEVARHVRDELVGQIEDYLLPRLDQMEAPLLMVVGGSTGAGKSTLVNSLVGATVSESGVLRPTTRAPVLVCSPADVPWFADDRVLPGMPRTVGAAAGPGGLRLAATEALEPGLALLDAPDIDSVVEANRTLARQLLAAADSWLFVTTAARYADAVPWDLLQAARERGTALCLVLDRVPPGAEDEVASHLGEMLAERGLGDTELLVVREAVLEDERLPENELAPVRSWLDGLAADSQARATLVRRTLTGALDSLEGRVESVLATVAEQQAVAEQLAEDVEHAYARARDDVDASVEGGSLLRGEVLARWHEVVGTGDVMRALESRIGWLRDRLRSVVTGAPAPEAELRTAVQSSIDALVHTAADRAAEETAASWRARPAGRALLDAEGAGRLDAVSPELEEATRTEVRDWQRFVFELVREEGQDKRSSARLASLGVNGAGLTVMLAVFIQTGGLTGAEVAVAGGTSALGQKVLEAIFGDQAVRSLAAKARVDLLGRVERLLARDAERFVERLALVAPGPGRLAGVERALAAVQRAR